MICRRNDMHVDAGNGTRGTVRVTLDGALVIDTDVGMCASYRTGSVVEHVEHAYCLTSQGMQGAESRTQARRRARRSPRAVRRLRARVLRDNAPTA